MKKTRTAAATPHQYSVLRQICNYIPVFLVAQLARATRVDEETRTFSPWSHIVALLYAQLTHAIGLNDVCDALLGELERAGGPRGKTTVSTSTHESPATPCFQLPTPLTFPTHTHTKRQLDASPSPLESRSTISCAAILAAGLSLSCSTNPETVAKTPAKGHYRGRGGAHFRGLYLYSHREWILFTV